MRGNVILLIIVTLIAIGLSVMLVPKEKDIAFLKLKSNDIEGARSSLDAQMKGGDLSVSVIASRTDLALHDGDVPTAVKVMETFVAANPDDTGAWRRLAEYYRFNQQQLKYVETLAHVVRIDGTDEERHLLANQYRLHGQHDNLLRALKDLNDRGLANAAELAEAAEIAAGTGDYKTARALLNQLMSKYPDAVNPHLLTMMVLLADSEGQRNEAVDLLTRIADHDQNSKKVEPVLYAAQERGNAPLGLALIKPLDRFVERSPAMLSLWSQINLSSGKRAVVQERLFKLEKAGKLPNSSLAQLVQLLLDSQNLPAVEQLMADRNIGILPEWLLSGVIDAALESRSKNLLLQVVRQAPDLFRELRPASYALAVAGAGDHERAGAMASAMDRKMLLPANRTRNAEGRLRLSRLWFLLRKPEKALTHLKVLARNRKASDSTYRTLTGLLIQLERYQDGLKLFGDLRRKNPTPVIEVSWARLSAAAGNDPAAVEWMGQRLDLGVQALTSIYEAAGPDRAPKTALLAAERLVNRQPNTVNQNRLAAAFLANGQFRQAGDILRGLLPGDPQIRSTYADVLEQLGQPREARDMLLRDFDPALSSPDYADRVVSMTLSLGELERAISLAEQIGLTRIQPVTIASLVEAVSLTGDTAETDRLINTIDPAILAQRPVMAARIAMARGRPDEAGEWVLRADRRSDLSVQDRLDLAQIQLTRGENLDAQQRLVKIAQSPETPTSALVDLASLYVQTDQVSEGLPLIRRLAAERPDPALTQALSVMEATAGAFENVAAWLQTTQQPSRQSLLDIYYAAESHENDGIASLTAQKLITLYPGQDATVIRARTLVRDGQASDAVRLLKPLLPGTGDIRALYITALVNSNSTDDLTTFADSALSDPDLSPSQRETILYALLNANMPEKALPALADLAEQQPEKWQETYVNALVASGDTDRLKAYAQTALDKPDTPERVRENLVYALLNIQANDIALPELRRLAAASPDKWQGTYIAALAGKKHASERLTVLKKRLAQTRPGKARDQLLYDLLATAGPKTALPYIRKRAARENNGPWTATYVQALRDLNRTSELLTYYRKRSLSDRVSVKERREAAFVLLEMKAKKDAENAFLKLANSAKPDSPDVQQLLFLWGPRPPKSARDWLHKRAADAPRRQRVKWLQLLNQSGEYATLAQLPDAQLPRSMNDRATPTFVDAMQRNGDRARLRRFLDRLAPTAETLREKQRLIEWAESARHPTLAGALYQEIAARKKLPEQTLFKAGQNRFFAGKYQQAIPILTRYIKQAGNDFDPRATFYRAQSQSALRRTEAARSDYRKTLQRMQKRPPKTLEMRRILVQSLVGTRQFEKAVTGYESLLKDAPENQDIRADFAALLIETGDLDRAELLLAAR